MDSKFLREFYNSFDIKTCNRECGEGYEGDTRYFYEMGKICQQIILLI